ncbi:methyl-accepting chemotaxis protein [Marinomonas sp. C2222]|uniref:Methyl-accepting chemotaxis protein n=1 Tax=Marinomonas sargassi TaxID=2984494 RepID=A0ABT2YUP0_9GAMM|nr:methyl-accepting chemotaxis protein [Marinomonas sargassi]MCV2403612.1 methyl-accepting chemotaxis protein [Marinomonas sargassi]
MMNRLGFKGSLIATVLVVLLLTLSVSGWLSYKTTKEQVTENVTSDLRFIIDEEVDSLLAVFKRAEEVVTTTSNLFEEKGYGPSDYPLVLMLSAKSGGVSKLTLGFEDGTSYVSKPSSKTFPGGVGITSKYDPRIRPWYKEGKASPGLSHSKPFFTKSGHPILAVSHTVKNGVLAADVRFSNLQTHLEGVLEKSGMATFVMDKSGLIIASTIAEVVPQENITNSSINAFIQKLLSSETRVAETALQDENQQNQNLLFLAEEIPLINDGKWYFFAAVDRDEALSPVADSVAKLLGTLSIMAIISVLVLLYVLKVIYAPILSLRDLISGLSQGDGDLTQRLKIHSDDDIGQIALGINKFIEQLQSLMKEVKNSTEQFTGRVESIYQQSEENSTVLEQHAVETEHIVAAVEELSSSAVMVAEHSNSAASSAMEAKGRSTTANDMLRKAQDQIALLASEVLKAADNVKQMDQKTGDIQSIVEVIGGIAEQTNLLALNASIEAARAGEQGRGFAVVADEVRALANRTQDSTTEIGNAISNLQVEATSVVSAITGTQSTCDATVEGAESVSQTLQALSEQIVGINDMNAEISGSADEQSRVIQTVSENITELHGMVEKLSNIAKGQYEEVHHIAEINKNLGNIIGKFKV